MQADDNLPIIKLGDNQNFPVEADPTLIVRDADKHLWMLFNKAVLKGDKLKV
jgi:hypothetical protein